MPAHALELTVVFLLAVLLSTAVQLWLDARQKRHVLRHRQAVPVVFADRIGLEAHQKAADYTAAKLQLNGISVLLSAVVLIAWTVLGGLEALQATLVSWGANRWGTLPFALLLLAAFGLISAVIEWPLSIYQTFVLEARFGFNRTTWRLWLVDGLKGACMALLIGLPLAAVVLGLMGSAGPAWWLWAWAAFMALQLLLLWLYPTWIAPWFNRFEPLQDETLAAQVRALMSRCGFHAQGLYVMDGSRRSAHGNAYFTGFGTGKRVVFYDTLLQRLKPRETVAVLAHELGHFHHKHILKRVLGMGFVSWLGFALLGWLAQQAWFYAGLGVSGDMPSRDAIALLLFMLALPPFTFFVSPLLATWSRRDEFQADAYARRQTHGADLASALLKLYEDNAGTLTPDPLYVRFYASHPPAAQRLAALTAAP